MFVLNKYVAISFKENYNWNMYHVSKLAADWINILLNQQPIYSRCCLVKKVIAMFENKSLGVF